MILRGGIDSSGRPLTTEPTFAPGNRSSRPKLAASMVSTLACGNRLQQHLAEIRPELDQGQIGFAHATRKKGPGKDAGPRPQLEDGAFRGPDFLGHQLRQRHTGRCHCRDPQRFGDPCPEEPEDIRNMRMWPSRPRPPFCGRAAPVRRAIVTLCLRLVYFCQMQKSTGVYKWIKKPDDGSLQPAAGMPPPPARPSSPRRARPLRRRAMTAPACARSPPAPG